MTWICMWGLVALITSSATERRKFLPACSDQPGKGVRALENRPITTRILSGMSPILSLLCGKRTVREPQSASSIHEAHRCVIRKQPAADLIRGGNRVCEKIMHAQRRRFLAGAPRLGRAVTVCFACATANARRAQAASSSGSS